MNYVPEFKGYFLSRSPNQCCLFNVYSVNSVVTTVEDYDLPQSGSFAFKVMVKTSLIDFNSTFKISIMSEYNKMNIIWIKISTVQGCDAELKSVGSTGCTGTHETPDCTESRAPTTDRSTDATGNRFFLKTHNRTLQLPC